MKPTKRQAEELKLEVWHWPSARKGELLCPHGVGHGGIHGCDGCCRYKSFKDVFSEYKKNGFKERKFIGEKGGV